MEVLIGSRSRYVVFDTNPGNITDCETFSIWDDQTVIMEMGDKCTQYIPSLKEWEAIANVANTNIRELKKKPSEEQTESAGDLIVYATDFKETQL